MSWFRLDDKFHSNHKVLSAGNAAVGLYVRLGTYSADHRKNGFIPAGVVRTYGKRSEIEACLREQLIVEVDGGYQIPDYLDFNPTAEEVEDGERVRHEKKADAGRMGGIASGVARRRHSKREAEPNQTGSTTEAEGEQNEAPTPTPPPTPLTTLDDDLRQLPGRDPSSSFTPEEAAAHQLARINLQRRKGEPITDVDGWVAKVRKAILTERIDDIRYWSDMGLHPTEIARRVAGPAAPPPRAHQDYGHPAECVCDGTGWLPVDSEDESRASFVTPCTTVWPEATVHELRRNTG